ncbi:MAG TPA: hypothetical protein VF665_16670 [Longimicrobium sp.]|uniref:hypothetical protein n=1 Tax=Longimicrobium sp. TaxID=2029185 RepID=UPI002ED901CB
MRYTVAVLLALVVMIATCRHDPPRTTIINQIPPPVIILPPSAPDDTEDDGPEPIGVPPEPPAGPPEEADGEGGGFVRGFVDDGLAPYPAWNGYDLDCDDVNGPVRVDGPDPHRLDGDGDGVGCEG